MSASTEPPVILSSAALPSSLPIFPLSGALLLPRGRLPLNIFEPRYLAMVEDALGSGRLIGMVQPSGGENAELVPPVYQVGCAGRITSFTETEDGRFLINLLGLCRFRIAEELPMERGYRRAKPDWEKFLGDLDQGVDPDIDRDKLMHVLRGYFKLQGITADWNAVQNTPNDTLISSLAMICPLAANEKQALLEAPDLHERAELLMALLEMASMPQAEIETAAKH